MTTPNILFICSGAIDRSPCAASLIEGSKFAGTSPLTETPATEKLVNWANLIACMEHFHKRELYEQILKSKQKDIIVLDIPNDHLRYNPKLKELLKKKLTEKNISY